MQFVLAVEGVEHRTRPIPRLAAGIVTTVVAGLAGRAHREDAWTTWHRASPGPSGDHRSGIHRSSRCQTGHPCQLTRTRGTQHQRRPAHSAFLSLGNHRLTTAGADLCAALETTASHQVGDAVSVLRVATEARAPWASLCTWRLCVTGGPVSTVADIASPLRLRHRESSSRGSSRTLGTRGRSPARRT